MFNELFMLIVSSSGFGLDRFVIIVLRSFHLAGMMGNSVFPNVL